MSARITGTGAPHLARAAWMIAGLLLLFGGAGGPASAQSDAPGATPAAAGDVAKTAAADSTRYVPVRPPATPEELAEGQKLLARAVKATFIGEPSELHSFSWSDTGTFSLGNQGFPIRTVNVLIPSHCYWTEQLLPMGPLSMGFCDGTGWSKSQRGVRDLAPEEVKVESRSRQMDLLRVLVEAAKLKARPIADTVLAAGPAAGVSVDDDQVLDWRLYMNKETGRIVRSDFLDLSPMGGPPVRQAFEYSDYQPVDGKVRWPGLTMKFVNGTKFFDLTMQKAAWNPQTEPTLFDKPKE